MHHTFFPFTALLNLATTWPDTCKTPARCPVARCIVARCMVAQCIVAWWPVTQWPVARWPVVWSNLPHVVTDKRIWITHFIRQLSFWTAFF